MHHAAKHSTNLPELNRPEWGYMKQSLRMLSFRAAGTVVAGTGNPGGCAWSHLDRDLEVFRNPERLHLQLIFGPVLRPLEAGYMDLVKWSNQQSLRISTKLDTSAPSMAYTEFQLPDQAGSRCSLPDVQIGRCTMARQ